MTYKEAAEKLKGAQRSIALLMPYEWLRLNLAENSGYTTAVDMAVKALERLQAEEEQRREDLREMFGG